VREVFVIAGDPREAAGEFAGAVGLLSAMDELRGRFAEIGNYYPVWGVDVARFGDDRTALAKRQKNKLLEPVRVLRRHSPG
jgi:hypothetical protein